MYLDDLYCCVRCSEMCDNSVPPDNAVKRGAKHDTNGGVVAGESRGERGMQSPREEMFAKPHTVEMVCANLCTLRASQYEGVTSLRGFVTLDDDVMIQQSARYKMLSRTWCLAGD